MLFNLNKFFFTDHSHIISFFLASDPFPAPWVRVLFHTQINLKMPVQIPRIPGLWPFTHLLFSLSFIPFQSFVVTLALAWPSTVAIPQIASQVFCQNTSHFQFTCPRTRSSSCLHRRFFLLR